VTNSHWEKVVVCSGELEGRVVFIAGVGPQMGSACARIAAREGASVILAARSFAEPLAAEIRAAGGNAIAVTCDLTDKGSLRAAVEEGAAAFGTIDGVFYNAGYYDNDHDTIDVDDDEWRMTIDVNYTGAHILARLVMPGMIARGHGSFVFNSSAASIITGQVIHLDGGLFARASWPTNAAPFQPPVKAEAAA
jgi:NAD(P)-dependent dehydrogenase (short-subunit alcohol dehydrogenase family)